MKAETVSGIHKQIVVMGDFYQLPSVGAGAVLRDLLLMPEIPKVKLTRIFRQASAGKNLISQNAAKINAGVLSLEYGEGFNLIPLAEDELIAQKLLDGYMYAAEKHGLDEVLCLVPTNGNAYVGVNLLNAAIQDRVNPRLHGKDEVTVSRRDNSLRYNLTFRVGDRVINSVNDTERGVVNGDIGTVMRCGTRNHRPFVDVQFSTATQLTSYVGEDINALKLAYALTVHKSQGSEAACVLIGLSNTDNHSLQQRTLLYTAVTRAKKECYIVGPEVALVRSIQTNTMQQRETALPRVYERYKSSN